MLAKHLKSEGVDVTWWSSRFDHANKRFRDIKSAQYESDTFGKIIYLDGPSYRKNVSFRRVMHHRSVAADFQRIAATLEKPDVILCCMPIPELCQSAITFGKKYDVPVVLDIRDLWPDEIQQLFSQPLRWAISLLLLPMRRQVQFACRNATALSGTSDGYVEWGLQKGGRQKESTDRSFPLAYTKLEPSSVDISEGKLFWKEHGIGEIAGELTICYFGMLGALSQLETVIDCARHCQKVGKKIKFIICGDGDKLPDYQKRATGLDNLLFTGRVGAKQIWTLMRIADCGLVCYPDTISYRLNVPNKAIEYLSGGLPLIYCQKGALHDLAQNEGVGYKYENGSPKSLFHAIEDLKNNEKKRNKMSLKAIELFQNKFVAEEVYSSLGKYLKSFCESSA
ncbi:glycosyltransferase family 4 protein [Verrucomicrobia bacterium]|nr:glycosyltransferase family 4 protein [Verrucomicrobiota bacterium]